jgi:hypothetical protein
MSTIPIVATPPAGAVLPPPPTAPLVPTQIVVGASSATAFNTLKEYAHQAAAIVGLLMVVYTAIIAAIHQADPSLATPDLWVGALGGGIITASKLIDSWSFTNLNAPVSNTIVNTGGP